VLLLLPPPPGNALENLPEGLFNLPKLHTLNVSRNKVGFITS
jgi:Leucine-rich repeat (LRR) protein